MISGLLKKSANWAGDRVHLEADQGFDSPLEQAAALRLFEFNQTTGPLAGATVVRIIEHGGKPQIFAWMIPHFYDPVQVMLTREGAKWRWVDHPNDDPKEPWRTDFKSNSVARGMVVTLGDFLKITYPQLATTAAPLRDDAFNIA